MTKRHSTWYVHLASAFGKVVCRTPPALPSFARFVLLTLRQGLVGMGTALGEQEQQELSTSSALGRMKAAVRGELAA